jgi:3-methyladenine DNA glycosylase AlkD
VPGSEASLLARGLARELALLARPAPGFDAVAYLSSPVPVLGVRVPELRDVVRGFYRAHREWPLSRVHALVKVLWARPSFEERILAIEITARYRARLDDASWRMVDRWVDSATGWGLSDSLAGTLLGPMAADHAGRRREILRWTRSPNPWRRRPALYAAGTLVRRGELDFPFEVIDRLTEDPEFWVQRAVGTWLRECWKKDRARTEQYLRRKAAVLPPVVVTVATERAPSEFRQELRALRPPRTRGSGAADASTGSGRASAARKRSLLARQ